MPEALDFTPGDLVGSVSGDPGLRKFVEDADHTLVVTCYRSWSPAIAS
jgi:formate dehydrogenase